MGQTPPGRGPAYKSRLNIPCTILVDINNDGLNDIYVCRSYYGEPSKRTNQLFINNGDYILTRLSSDKFGLWFSQKTRVPNFSFLDKTRDGQICIFFQKSGCLI